MSQFLSHNRDASLIAILLRTACMRFLNKDVNTKKQDIVLDTLEKAGYELIKFKKVKNKTKKLFEQNIVSNKILASAGNMMMDKMIKEKELPFVRNF